MAHRQRSAMFFESDLNVAAETAASSLEDHGLTDVQVQELADQIGDTIRDYFGKLRDA